MATLWKGSGEGKWKNSVPRVTGIRKISTAKAGKAVQVTYQSQKAQANQDIHSFHFHTFGATQHQGALLSLL